MQISKNRNNPGFPIFYLKRLSLLLIVGLLHTLLWSGDILMLYAIMGMILLALRHVSESKAIWMGLAFYFFPIVLDVIYMYTFVNELPIVEKTALKVYPDMLPAEVVSGFQNSQLWVVKTNMHNVIWRWYDFIPSGRPLKVLGYFLYSIDFFTIHAKRWKYIILFLFVGLLFTGMSMSLKGSVSSYSKNWFDILNKLIYEIGQLSLSLSYVCILSKLVEAFPKFFVFNLLKNYGRMSLTSYLGHSVLGIIVFYPIIAWGYFGLINLEQVYYIAILILTFQLVFSNIWFIYFHFGPVEWQWRCATFGKWFPIKKIKS